MPHVYGGTDHYSGVEVTRDHEANIRETSVSGYGMYDADW